MSRRYNNRILKLFHSRIFVMSAAVVLVFMTYSTFREIRQRYNVEREIQKLRDEVSMLESQNMELSRLIQYFQTDSFVEREGRTKLGLSLPGEKVVIIPRNESGDKTAATGEEKAVPKDAGSVAVDGESDIEVSITQKWWQYFFGKRGKSINL